MTWAQVVACAACSSGRKVGPGNRWGSPGSGSLVIAWLAILGVIACVGATACGGAHAAQTGQLAPALPASSAPSPRPAAAARSADTTTHEADAGPETPPLRVVARAIPLPGANGLAGLDYIAYSTAGSQVWVPTASTGSVDVLDTKTETFVRVEGFPGGARTNGGRTRIVGPSSVAVGLDFVFIGNRLSNEVCPVAIRNLEPRRCAKLPSGIDGVAFVAKSREVWVTSPQAHELRVLDASEPGSVKPKVTIPLGGSPEGFAVDEAGGRFFTNLEDKGDTVVIDVADHKVTTTWNAGCGPDGPRGIAYAADRGFVVVACTDHIQVLDAAHEGARLGRLETGSGVDNIDYKNQSVYVAAARVATLTVANVDAAGELHVIARGDTSEGARNAVADEHGHVYVADSPRARVLVFDAPLQGVRSP